MSEITQRRPRSKVSLVETEIRLGPEHNGILMTPEEFDAIDDYDDLWRYELVHGVLIVTPIPAEAEVGPNGSARIMSFDVNGYFVGHVAQTFFRNA